MTPFRHLFIVVVALVAVPAMVGAGSARQSFRHDALDRLLDTYVRGGQVYYKALRAERSALDGYVQSLNIAPETLARFSEAEQKAFWINAYNALVLQTVAHAYPIRGTASMYPRTSIRQIPGAFERRTHRVAGESLTLDAIEDRMISRFGDARIVLALGRGANGSGRLRSEAFTADALEAQLTEAVAECAQRVSCFAIDKATQRVTVSPLFGWHTEAFEKSFAKTAGTRWSARTPIERAVVSMVLPHLFQSEREFLEQDRFSWHYGEFDWSLNEL